MSLSRRSFVKGSSALLGLGVISTSNNLLAATEVTPESISFGLVADAHYADIPTGSGNRCYRESLAKLRQAVANFNQRSLSFVVELGDLIDAGSSVKEDQGYLKKASGVLQTFTGDCHFVLGNHCVRTLTKQQFLDGCGAKTKDSYYSFDHGDFHFVVLDGDFREDGVEYEPGNAKWTDTALPEHQIAWLKEDLAKAKGKVTTIFIHQNLDCDGDPCCIDNCVEVRKVLEAAGNVAVVFQGHLHEGGYRKIGGIHYCTLQAMVVGSGLENNAYAIATLNRDGTLQIETFGKQPEFKLQ